MAELNSLMYLDSPAFSQASSSLAGRGTAVHPIRLKMLTDTKTIGAGNVSWGVLGDLKRPWGDSTAVRYDEPQLNWAYHWNSGTGIFAVTDNTGSVTLHHGVYTLSGLGISWAVIASGQFGITDTNYSNSSAFLIASKVIEGKSSRVETAIPWTNDYLAEGGRHALFDRLSLIEIILTDVNLSGNNGYGDEAGSLERITEYFGDDTLPDILLSRGAGMQAVNDYSLNLLASDPGNPAVRHIVDLAGQQFAGVGYLMIALFAQRLLSTDSKMLYEPWMLYEIFRWYFSSPHYEANARRIFDLSPNWG
ncbi:hypothetical protein [Acetonema longum]|uniref:Uncharacterized protein n=1 Tax=Acetonema longum DSM 6540 TaxID=1009370 RepID=F7NEA8_9FIRM|nr:hypothetical protein [Acetonema longum]EGO65620.1 hypothetical protein ALO_01854 [Acetonema longum DSM 6540]